MTDSLEYCRERIAFHLLERDREGARELSRVLAEAAERIRSADETDRATAIGAFHELADQLPGVWDTDYGAALLEANGDGCGAPAVRLALYREARKRAERYAACASSGGEGMARMEDVKRLDEKIDRIEAET